MKENKDAMLRRQWTYTYTFKRESSHPMSGGWKVNLRKDEVLEFAQRMADDSGEPVRVYHAGAKVATVHPQ